MRRAAWLLCGLALTGCLSTDPKQWTASSEAATLGGYR